jgi:hypothetical protein
MAGFVAPSLMELNAKNVKDVVLDKIRAVKELDRAIAFSSVSEGGGPVSAVKCDKHVNHYAHLLWLRVLQVIRVIRVLGPVSVCFCFSNETCSIASRLCVTFSDLLPVVADSTPDWSREIDFRHSVVFSCNENESVGGHVA